MSATPNYTLQSIYSVFLGLALVAFFGIGMATFYPSPDQPDNVNWDAWRPVHQQWSTYTSVALLVFAVLTLVVALFWAYKTSVLANGLLLGGLFTLFYAVFYALDSGISILRFTIVTIALIVSVAVGWYRFSYRGGRPAGPAATRPPTTSPDGAADPSVCGDVLATLNIRVTRIERQLDAIADALGSPEAER